MARFHIETGPDQQKLWEVDMTDAQKLATLAADWKSLFDFGASRHRKWKSQSIQFCTALRNPPMNAEDLLTGILKEVSQDCVRLSHYKEGHRLVEAALYGHVDAIGKDIATELLTDAHRITVYSCRVWSALFRNGSHIEEVKQAADYIASQSHMIWERRNRVMWVLETIVLNNYPCAWKIFDLWHRPDSFCKIVRKPFFIRLLLACLRSAHEGRYKITAMFLTTLENDLELGYTMIKAITKVRPCGIEVLCELAKQSLELNIWFADIMQEFLEKVEKYRPSILPYELILTPSNDLVATWLVQTRVLGDPKEVKEAYALTECGAAAFGLYCRLLQVQVEEEWYE